MDLRIVKTLRSIDSAFLALLERSELDQITVKALCEAAQINKATFYAHYSGLYALIEAVEDRVISEIRAQNTVNRAALQAPEDFLLQMLEAFSSNTTAKKFLNSNRRAVFLNKLFDGIRTDFYREFPGLDPSGFDFTLAFVFHGLMGITTACDGGTDSRERIAAQLGESIALLFRQALL